MAADQLDQPPPGRNGIYPWAKRGNHPNGSSTIPPRTNPEALRKGLVVWAEEWLAFDKSLIGEVVTAVGEIDDPDEQNYGIAHAGIRRWGLQMLEATRELVLLLELLYPRVPAPTLEAAEDEGGGLADPTKPPPPPFKP